MYSHIKKISLLLVALGFFMLAFSKAQAQSPQVLFVVGNANTVSADDQALMDRMSTNLGYQVSLLDDNQVATSPDFSGNDLIVISHTINPGFIGSEFTNLAIPVFCSNFLLFDDLDIANTASRGASKTEVNIIDGTHPLATGYNGDLVVYNAPSYMGYGNPSAHAQKVAIMGTKLNRATIFGYETGASMLSITAPARRVGFFLSNQGSAQALTAEGWELFDASVCWALGGTCGGSTPVNIPPVAQITANGPTNGTAPFSLDLDGSSSSDSDGSIVSWAWDDGNGNSQLTGTTFSPTYQTAGSYSVTLTVTDNEGASHTASLEIEVSAANTSSGNGEILFVVGNANNLSLDDQALEVRMTQDNGKDVTIVDDDNYGSANLEDYSAIVVSHTVNANVVANAFQATTTPVFMLKWLLLDDMFMAFRNTRAANKTDVNIHDPNHVIANGQTGSVSVYDAPTYMGYASPGLGANTIAIFGNKISRATIFTYEANAVMITGNAPAKRASFFISGEGDVRKLTEEGWGFFDAIIDWITPNVPILPISACYQPPIEWAAPSSGVNRIINRTFRKPLTDASQATLARDVQETVTYIDGLGKTIQTHMMQATPGLKDQVIFSQYDELGRSPEQYLPFGISNNDGALINNPISAQQSFYNAEFPDYSSQALFAETDFEASPLNRVLEQGAAGDAWQIERNAGVSTKNGHTVQANFRSNYFDPLDASTNVDQVLRWHYSPLVDKFSVIAHYSNNELSVIESIDENKSRILEYTDKLGRVILRRAEVDGNTSNSLPQSWANTYFLYDDKGNLRHVIQPEGLVALQANGYNLNGATVKDEFLFSYKYDELNRLIEKKVPNAAKVQFVYDQLGRVVFTQDGNLSEAGQWMATKYDEIGRPIITGLYMPTSPKSRADLQTILDAAGPNSEKRAPLSSLDIGNQIINGFSNTAFPSVSDMEVHAVTYFDSYDIPFISGGSPYFYTESLIPNNQPNNRTKGMVSGTRVRVLGSNDWHWTITYYDEYGSEIQTQSDHQMGVDVLSQQVNFAGEIIKTVERHNGSQGLVLVVQKFCYDHEGRLIRTTHQVNQDPEIILAKYEYDEMSRQQDKKIHSTDNGGSFLQSVDYRYNIHSWITAINQLDPSGPQLQSGEDVIDLFSMQLDYNSDELNAGPNLNVTSLYNGNISAIAWQDAFEEDMHIYAYQYDKLNRLLQADYAAFGSNSWNKNTGRYNTAYTYDKNGNIKGLIRNGKTGTNSYGLLDELVYSYKNGISNQLLSVTDAGNNANGVAIDQFIDGNTSGSDYFYDANGNIVEDINKGIQISYNHLNKPASITWIGTSNRIDYVYNAAGSKLTQIVSGSQSVTRDYINSFHYTDNELEFFSHQEGRVVKENTGSFHYEYNLQDHLGNIRLTFSDLNNDKDIDTNSEIIQTDHYYPFGMRMSFNASQQAAVAQRYQYNGKELQDDFGLNWSDHGARMYDPSIARWNGVDALSEAYRIWSPYNYVLNNPILLIDPTGNNPEQKVFTFVITVTIYKGESCEEGSPCDTEELEIVVDATYEKAKDEDGIEYWKPTGEFNTTIANNPGLSGSINIIPEFSEGAEDFNLIYRIQLSTGEAFDQEDDLESRDDHRSNDLGGGGESGIGPVKLNVQYNRTWGSSDGSSNTRSNRQYQPGGKGIIGGTITIGERPKAGNGEFDFEVEYNQSDIMPRRAVSAKNTISKVSGLGAGRTVDSVEVNNVEN